ncbi:MAG: hypothetical protein LBG57_05150 [Treponema sp.]|nr:hypothetical protein [Treponema sp.]
MIFDECLEDKIVEIAKGNTLSQLDPDTFASEIHFDVIRGQRVLRLLCKDHVEGKYNILYVPDFDKLYLELSGRYKHRLPVLDAKSFCVVNLDYAADFLRALETEG